MSVVGLKNVIANVLSKDDSKNNKLLSRSTSQSNYGGINTSELLIPSDRGAELVSEEQSIGSRGSNFSNQTAFTSFLNKFDPRVMSDIIIGLSDGLTVPFALSSALTSLGDSQLVITGGFAELVSGAISMGLGGYLAAKSESQYYHNTVTKEKQSFFKNQNELECEVIDILEDIGITNESAINLFIDDLEKKPAKLVDFIIRYGKGLEEPAEGREITSALTIGLSYFFGGFVPLIPYFFVATVQTGLIVSCIVMAIALFIFGYVKTIISIGNDCGHWQKISEGFQMLFVGGFAAACAWLLVRLIES
ncbi:Ccc1 protein [Saccharomycopsis crataegensis]|uniref:Ccc1 protein n=1 Tax=Saccharomycopsis crataegensis TaxID=43959 RepID=A0AAV5QMR1_9ASCO|nr:Ccc1 protein [Saccharomycopsis crataegensis]